MLGAAQMAEPLEEQHLATVAALAAALEAKDAYTGGHAQTIAEFAVLVGEELGLSGRELQAVRMGALLHDVGKIGIPEAILNKPGPLTDDEFTVMKRHTVIGADIISGIPGMDEVVALVRSSHERWDGRGYPDGLRGADIPRGACVIAVCDAYHAMTEDRVYRKAMSVEGALAELRRCTGTQFMPAAVEALETWSRAAAAAACASPTRPRTGLEPDGLGGRAQPPAALTHPRQQAVVGSVPAARVGGRRSGRCARAPRPCRPRARPAPASRRRAPARRRPRARDSGPRRASRPSRRAAARASPSGRSAARSYGR